MAQEVYRGNIRNNLNEPIEGVVISVYKVESPDKTQSLTLSDNLGNFELLLLPFSNYLITTKHISYKDESVLFNTSTTKTINISLQPADYVLNEIIIKHEKPKVTIKRDTVSFNLSKYIDSNDRKLRDLVKKLPGLIVLEDGTIYFKGQRITKLLVENEEFFGGGTKLGLDNIPANAIEKLEIIANYSKSNLLKNNRKSEAQVINLILKENRKSIIFGSVNGASNFKNFHKLHGSIFRFQPKLQTNFIGDSNNIAEQSLSQNESYSFANINSEIFELENIQFDVNDKANEYAKVSSKLLIGNVKIISENSTWDIVGFVNRNKDRKSLTELNEYLNNSSFEDKNENEISKNGNYFIRTSNYYQTPLKERLVAMVFNYYGANNNNQILSNSFLGNRIFEYNEDDNNLNLDLVFEEIKPLKNDNRLAYGLKVSIKNEDNQSNLKSNQQFLEEIIPWIDEENYLLTAPKRIESLNFETGLNYYKRLNDFQTITMTSKLIFYNKKLNINQTQILIDDDVNFFNTQFSSDSKLNRIQSINQMIFRFKKENWDLNIGFDINSYNFEFSKFNYKNQLFRISFNPIIDINYIPNNKKQLLLKYSRDISLPSIEMLDNYIKITDYTSVLIGNINLENGISHNLSFNYSDFNIPKNYSLQISNNLNITEKAIVQNYEFNNINSTSNYVLQNNGNYSFYSRNKFFYLFKSWELGLRFNYTLSSQKILFENTLKSLNSRLNIAPNIKTTFPAFPNVSLTPYIQFNSQVLNNEERKFISKGFLSKIEYDFSSKIYANIIYNYSNIDNRKAFDTLDFELRYTNKAKTLDLSIIGVNSLGRNINRNILQYDFLRTSIISETLGRRILLGCSYYF